MVTLSMQSFYGTESQSDLRADLTPWQGIRYPALVFWYLWTGRKP